jgi:hypothetical protein
MAAAAFRSQNRRRTECVTGVGLAFRPTGRSISTDVVLTKFFASFFILVIVLPFTEPWPVIQLAPFGRGHATQAAFLPSPLRGATKIALETSPASPAPHIANPITLLPPLRLPFRLSRDNAKSASAIPIAVTTTALMTTRSTVGSMCRSGPPVLRAATPGLRV